MITKFFKHTLWVPLLVSTFFGCGGILDCPIDPPSCCYNVLFGCDIFEIPDGCTCAQYGLLQTSRLTVKSAPLIERSPGLVGTWQGDLSRISTSCSKSLYLVSGNARIRKFGKGVKIDIPGYGRLNGGLSGKRINAKGEYKVGSCSAQLKTSLLNSRAGVAKTRVSFKYSCEGKKQCESEYLGTLLKQQSRKQ